MNALSLSISLSDYPLYSTFLVFVAPNRCKLLSFSSPLLSPDVFELGCLREGQTEPIGAVACCDRTPVFLSVPPGRAGQTELGLLPPATLTSQALLFLGSLLSSVV